MCWALQADLVKIDDEAEQRYLESLIRHMGPFFLKGDAVWIGLSDVQHKGTWTWVTDDSKPMYTKWSQDIYNETTLDFYNRYAWMRYVDGNLLWDTAHNSQMPKNNGTDTDDDRPAHPPHKLCEKEPDHLFYEHFAMDRLMLIPRQSQLKIDIKGLSSLAKLYYKYVYDLNVNPFMDVFSAEQQWEYSKTEFDENPFHIKAVASPAGTFNMVEGDSYECLRTLREFQGSHCKLSVDKTGLDHNYIIPNLTSLYQQGQPTFYRIDITPPTTSHGLSEWILAVPIDELSGMSSWTAWLPCFCAPEFGQLRTWRFRVCAHHLEPKRFPIKCSPLMEQPITMEVGECKNVEEDATECSASALKWTRWSPCYAKCGENGQQNRRRLFAT